MKKILLLYPNYPTNKKSRNHKQLLPIGLLKIGAYYKHKGFIVKLQQLHEKKTPLKFQPDKIIITSLFTYYSKYVIQAVKYARKYYPNSEIEIGGIWATLMPEKCKQLTGADKIYKGVHSEAEKFQPDYSLLDYQPDFQIIHTTRGCNRRCENCGVYKLEETTYKKSIKNEIFKPKVIFYDNNMLNNPYIKNILGELIFLKKKGKIKYCESQSGFDGRILRKKPILAKYLKLAGFQNPKIAWDTSYKSWKTRKQEIEILTEAGFKKDKISVFMLLNFKQPYKELEYKRWKCFMWGVQVVPCRYRPLNQLYDNYKPRNLKQNNNDYYIHPKWTDAEIKQFNRNCYRHNICIRYNLKYFSRKMMNKSIPRKISKEIRNMTYNEVKKILNDAWNPALIETTIKKE